MLLRSLRPVGTVRTWTIICLVFVIICAVAFRGFIIYEIYPIGFQEQIGKYSEENSLDPYLVCAVIAATWLAFFNKDQK